jgi:hypothetical protein
MTFPIYQSFIINSSLYYFTHTDMSNNAIAKLLDQKLPTFISVEESDGSKQAYQVNSIEDNKFTKEPLYRVTPVTLDPFDFTTVVYRSARFIKNLDTGRDDDLVSV